MSGRRWTGSPSCPSWARRIAEQRGGRAPIDDSLESWREMSYDARATRVGRPAASSLPPAAPRCPGVQCLNPPDLPVAREWREPKSAPQALPGLDSSSTDAFHVIAVGDVDRSRMDQTCSDSRPERSPR